MAKYLVHGNYIDDGVKGLLKEGGSSRREAIQELVGSVGGSVKCVYYAFGGTDVFAIVDLPDNVSAAALSLVTNASGAVAVEITVLLTPEEIDAAAQKTPAYRPPGA
jgi:uncharacterized protein with GYD domain